MSFGTVGCKDAVTPRDGIVVTITGHTLPNYPLLGDTVVLEARAWHAGVQVTNVDFAWATGTGIPLGKQPVLTHTLPDTGVYEIVVRTLAERTTVANARVALDVRPNTAPTVRFEVVPKARLYDWDLVFAIARTTDAESDAQITWHADGVGLIGTGDTLRWVPGNAAAGVRVVTARAKDPQGNRADALAIVHALPTDRWLWSRIFHNGRSGQALVALSNDSRIYAGLAAGGSPHCFNCLDAITLDGELLWTRRLQYQFWDHSSGLTITPDGRIFALDMRGIAYAFDSDGTVLWRDSVLGQDIHGRFALAPDGSLYAAGNAQPAALIRIDPATGDVLWRVTQPGGYRAGPAIGPDGLITAQLSSMTLVVSPDGNVLRRDSTMPFGSGHYMSAVDRNGVTYYPSSSGHLTAIGLDGAVLWQLDLGARLGEPVIDASGILYVAAGGPRAYAIHPDGTILWQTDLRGYSWIPRLAVLADGTLLVALDWWLTRLTRDTGEVLETIEFLEAILSGLAVDEQGIIYLVTEDQRLTALRGWAALEPGAPWPIWRRDNRRTASVPTP